MAKSLMFIGLTLAPIILTPGEVSAMSIGEAISECFRIGGHWVFSGNTASCTKCDSLPYDSVAQCHWIVDRKSTRLNSSH